MYALSMAQSPYTYKASARLFCFITFFRKILTNTPLAVRFQKIDPPLGAVVVGTKIKRLDAKLLAHVGVDAELEVTWQPVRCQLY
jgi:hypothetical protein